MLTNLDKVLEASNNAIFVVGTKDMEGKIISEVLKSLGLYVIEIRHHRIWPDLGNNIIERIFRKNQKEKYVIFLNFSEILTGKKPTKFKKMISEGRIISVSDYLFIGSLKSLENGGILHYISNKRVLPKNSLTETHSIAEVVFRIAEEIRRNLPDVIKINGKEIRTSLALALAHFLENPDKSNPYLKHNEFMRLCIERLPKEFDLELNVVRKLKNFIGEFYLLTNIGICLSYSPKRVIPLDIAVKEIKEMGEGFLRQFYSPVINGKTLAEIETELSSNFGTILKNIEDVIKIKDIIFNVCVKNGRKYIEDDKNDVGIILETYPNPYVTLYAIRARYPRRFLPIVAMIPKSILVLYDNTLEGSIFYIYSKPYEPSKDSIPPAFLAIMAGPSLYCPYENKYFRGQGFGNVIEGIISSSTPYIPPLSILFSAIGVKERTPRGPYNLKAKLVHNTLYGDKNIAIGFVRSKEGYFFSISIAPWISSRAGINNYLVGEDFKKYLGKDVFKSKKEVIDAMKKAEEIIRKTLRDNNISF